MNTLQVLFITGASQGLGLTLTKKLLAEGFNVNGNQPNDPENAAEVLITLSEKENPPVHFFMGEEAYHQANLKIETIQKALKENFVLGTSTGFNK